MGRIMLWALVATSVAGGANAGAWPREEGSWFATAATRLNWPQDVASWSSAAPTSDYQTLYLEYGLTARWTLGLDIGRSVSGADKTIGFVQYPVMTGDSGARMTLQMGLGRLAGGQVVRPGLSVGWGLTRGWLSLDSVAEIAIDEGTDYKLDITWGRNLARDRKLIMQVQLGDPAADPPFARLAPSFVFPLNDRLQVETGATWGLSGDDSMGLKLGLWASF